MLNNPIRKGGIKLPTLSKPGTAADLLADKQLIDQNGQIVYGTAPKPLTLKKTVSTGNGSTQFMPSGCIAAENYLAWQFSLTARPQTITSVSFYLDNGWGVGAVEDKIEAASGSKYYIVSSTTLMRPINGIPAAIGTIITYLMWNSSTGAEIKIAIDTGNTIIKTEIHQPTTNAYTLSNQILDSRFQYCGTVLGRNAVGLYGGILTYDDT